MKIYQVDAFTDRPFAGNPAGVCVLPAAASDRWMQAVAAEMNASETAFLLQRPDGFDLRWFTPTTEVELCGHATLAAAHILWQTGQVDRGERCRFHTASGLLTAGLHGDQVELDFPAVPDEPAPAPEGLAEILGAEVVALPRQPVRPPGRGRLGGRRARPAPRPRTPEGVAGARGHGDQPRVHPGVRLRLALLRAGGRDRRGPGHRVGPLLPRALLGQRVWARTS